MCNKSFLISRYVLVTLLALSLILLAGCNGVPSLKGKSGNDGVQPTAAQENLGADSLGTETGQGSEASPTSETLTTPVTLYFADPSGQYLVPATRLVPKVGGIARATMEELIKGPEPGSDLLSTIPVGTSLKDINIRPDGVCIVDFSGEMIDNHAGGTAGELLTVYSVVNTLTQFPTVKKVQFLVDGRYQQTLAGHLDIRETLARDDSVIMPK